MTHRTPLLLLTATVLCWIAFAPADGPVIDGSDAHRPYLGHERDPLRLSGAMKALDWWAAARAYPETTFPARGWAEGFEAARALPRPESDGKAWTDWQAIGPHNIGGRTVCVAYNPQNPTTVWAGSASGGVWRSYTGGVGAAAWERVETGHPVLGVSSVAFAPGDSSVIYLGTGEVYAYGAEGGGIAVRLTRGSYGIGVLKSRDGGATWGKSLDWSYDQRRGVQAVKVDPTNPDKVWAGTTEGVYKSTNAGLTWEQVHDVIMVTDLAIHPGNPDIVVAACGNLSSAGQGLYRTTDGGDSWTKIVQPGVIPTSYAGKGHLGTNPSFPDRMVASLSRSNGQAVSTVLISSSDGGATWQLRSSVDYALWQGWFSHDAAMNPQDPDLVIAVGVDAWRSTTGGSVLVKESDWRLWEFGITPIGGPEGAPDYVHADIHDVVWHPVDPNIVYFATDGGVFRSLDAGLTFEACNGGLQTTQFYAGFSTSRQDPDLAMGGLQDNSTAMYHGDAAWSRNIGGDGSWTAIHAVDDDILCGSYQYLNILRSTNQGADWSEVSVPTFGSVSFIAPYVFGGPSDPDVAYAASSYPSKSTDGGITYQLVSGALPLNGDPVLTIAVSPQDADVVYMATAPLNYHAAVFRSLDGGVSFQNVTGPLPDRYPVGLTVDPTAPQTVYAAFAGFGVSHLWRSRDAGGTWEDLGAGLPDVPTLSVFVDPLHPDHLYVGNDLGVFFSRDDGATWYDLSAGLGDAVMAMDLSLRADDMLLVSTYGNGCFVRPLERETTGAGTPPRASFELHGAAPNPFNPSTTIRFTLERDMHTTLDILDLRGAVVTTLRSSVLSGGTHTVRWNGRTSDGTAAPSGTYLARLAADDAVRTKKLQLLR